MRAMTASEADGMYQSGGATGLPNRLPLNEQYHPVSELPTDVLWVRVSFGRSAWLAVLDLVRSDKWGIHSFVSTGR